MGTEGWHLVARIDGKTGELQCFCGKRHPLPAGAGYKLCPPPQPVDLPRGELARIVEAHQQEQREAAEEMSRALLAQAPPSGDAKAWKKINHQLAQWNSRTAENVQSVKTVEDVEQAPMPCQRRKGPQAERPTSLAARSALTGGS